MRLFYFSLLVCWSFIGLAQEASNSNVSLTDLEVPDNPAFILLDAAPQTIQRPNTTRALGVSLLQDIVTEGTLKNIAIEVTPFWMTKHKNITALKFYGIDKDLKQNPFSKLKLASLSMAYIKDSDSVLNASFGVRATIFELKREDDIRDYYKAYTNIEKSLFNDLDIIDEYTNNNPEPERTDFASVGTFTIALKQYRLDRTAYVKAQQGSNADTYSNEMQSIIKRKPAIAVDLAVAYNHRFLNNDFDLNGFGRFGIWSTTAISLFLDQDKTSNNYVNIYGFLRYLHEKNDIIPNAPTDNFNAFDAGVKAEIEFKKLSIGYEYINRSGDMDSYRSAGTIKYQILSDIYITGTFGNNFEKQDDLISLFGLQWGFNHPLQTVGVPNPN